MGQRYTDIFKRSETATKGDRQDEEKGGDVVHTA